MGNGPLPTFPRDVIGSEAKANQELIGPFFVGIVVNYFLWGIQITQSYYYYKSYRKTDGVWLKAVVGILFIADAVQTICASEGVWHFVVYGWGTSDAIYQRLSPGFNLIPVTGAVTASIVQFFYARKIWTLLHAPYNHIFCVMVLVFSSLQLTAGTGCTGFMFSTQITLGIFYRIKTWAFVWLIPGSMTDILVTSLMTWKLSNSRTGFKATDDMISRMIRRTVETGLAPAICQILDLVIYLIWPTMSYHVTITLFVPKIYSNSMLALLNSRQPPKVTESSYSHPGSPANGIQICTTQTVAIHDDYGSLLSGGKTLQRGETTPDMQSMNTLSKSHEGSF